FRLLEGEREGVERSARRPLRQVRDRGGVDAAREENPERHVAREVLLQAILHQTTHTLLVHPLGLATRGAPVVLRQLLAALRVEALERSGPDRLDSFHRRRGTDDEPVPQDRRRRLGVEARPAEQARGKQRSNLGGERERPPGRRIPRARYVERLDAERIA